MEICTCGEMTLVKLKLKGTFIIRAEHNLDLIQFITDFAEKEKITSATFSAIGAFKKAILGYYDQEKHKYLERMIGLPQEIASCMGNLSLKDGKPFVHAHVVLSGENGETHAGHLIGGVVFAAEIHLQEFDFKLERKYDEVTGLSLWDMKRIA